MSELLIDSSDILFTIDKPMISFHINPKSNQINVTQSHMMHYSPISECIIKITNLMSQPIALRVRTTKKNFYAVNPTYCIILPNSNKLIKFLLYLKESYVNIDFSNHKFRFEGIVIDEEKINFEPKKIFEEIIRNKIKVKGNIIKRKTEIFEDLNYNFTNININNTNMSINFENNNLSQSTNVGTFKSANFKNFNQGNNLNKNSQLDYLKSEYNNLKNQLETLSQKYNNIKNTVENEKNKFSGRGEKQKIFFKLPEEKEQKVNLKIVIILCFSVFIFGFYLTN